MIKGTRSMTDQQADANAVGGITNEVAASIGGSVIQGRDIFGGVHLYPVRPKLGPPRQLPPDISNFVGRDVDMDELNLALTRSEQYPAAVVITAIAGTAGVGKTALAVHWGHMVRKKFPDGQLYVNLRGYGPGQSMTPRQALDNFLRALSVPVSQLPTDLDAQSSLYRSLLDGRRMLILLDNANAAAQVRPLLPGTSGCLVIVTSRSRLSGLAVREGAQRLTLELLSETDSLELLRRVIGSDRVNKESQAAAELARRCAYLPLALRIAADRAVIHTNVNLMHLVDELLTERDRLDLLVTDEKTTEVRAVFSWSYHALPSNAARVFRLIGMQAGKEISLNAVVALVDVPPSDARQILNELTGVHLV